MRSESDSSTTLDRPAATVSSAGTSRVKPSDDFIAEGEDDFEDAGDAGSSQAMWKILSSPRPARQAGQAVSEAQALAAAGVERNVTPKRLKAFIRPIA